MDFNRYEEFFKDMKKFKEKQKKQKQRGLNDYNMVNIVRKATDEVGMHSNIIYSLINPNGLHYQDDLFLQIFVKEVLNINDIGEIISVQREERTHNNKRIDFTIKSSKYYIGIEMKINADDSKNQLSDYYKDLKEKAKLGNIDEKNVLIYYLTKDGKTAAKSSSNGIKYFQISFKEHILKWIDECQKEVKNITNLNESFENYKQIVKKITNQYKGNVMTLLEYIRKLENEPKKQKEYINILNSLKTYEEEKNKIKKKFFIDYLYNYLSENLKGWKIKFGGDKKDINKKYKVNIQFYKDDKWDIVYWLRFEKNNMNSMYWAVVNKNKVNIDAIKDKFYKNGLYNGHKTSDISLLWKKSDYDLENNIEYLINKKQDKLAQHILEEFLTVMEQLETHYGFSLEEINKMLNKQ